MARAMEIAVPGSCFFRRKLGGKQGRRQVAARTDLLVVRDKTGHWRAALEEDERDILVMRSIYAVGEVARRLGHADRLLHGIRLSDFTHFVKLGSNPFSVAKRRKMRNRATANPMLEDIALPTLICIPTMQAILNLPLGVGRLLSYSY
jgi:hypothetical protein